MKSIIKKPGASIPIAMSIAALTMFLIYLAIFGKVHHEDKGTPAHVFQLLLAGQLPIVAFFAIKHFPKQPKQTLKILMLQLIAALIPIAVVFLIER